MKILLDENITKVLKNFLIENGHKVFHVTDSDIELDGKEDDEVLEWAIENETAVITQNGKHFVVMIPPKGEAVHHGLMWQKFELTKPKAKSVAEKIIDFLKVNTDISNSISHITRDNSRNIIIEKKYPIS